MQSILTMSEIKNRENEEQNQEMSEFEQLLDEFTYQVPKRGQIKEGEIKYMDENSIILDVGLKRDAVVQSSEINQLDSDFVEDLSIGDLLPVYIQRTPVGDEDLLVSVADALEYQNWKEARKIKEEGDIVDLKVVGTNKGGLLVKFDRIEGFVPNSHINGMKKFRSRAELSQRKQNLLGEVISVTPIEVDRENQRLVFSARAASASVQEQRMDEINEGEVLIGKVVNIVDFGVFVNLGGVDGLVHLSELAWKRIKHPANVVDIGDEIEVLVMSVDTERNRIQLSRKALIPGPWDVIEEKYLPGDLEEVKIVNVVDFGAFAQLPEGIQGLIHISELGYSSAADPLKTVEPGDEVLVKILKIDRNRERISLSMQKVPLEAQFDWSIAKEEAERSETSDIDQAMVDGAEEVEVDSTENFTSDNTTSKVELVKQETLDEEISDERALNEEAYEKDEREEEKPTVEDLEK